MKNVKPPQFLGNLYRDMRDRHMLLPALALVIGMLAVPVLLKSHSDAHKMATEAVNGGAQADAATPAVVTKELGVTNYKKRLDRLQSKNPFHQQYTSPPASAQAEAAPSASASSVTSSSATVVSPATASGSTSSVPPVSSSTTSGGTSAVSTASGGSDSAGSTHGTNPKPRYYAWRVSVKVGEPGELRERDQVQRLAMLPSEGKPAATFLGATEDGSKVLFLVSPDVDSVKGDGRCLPSNSSCRYVVLKPGDKANLHYAPNKTRYNIVLVDIHAVDVTDRLPKKPAGKGQPQQKLPLLGDG